MMNCKAELNEKGDRIEVTFPFDPEAVKAIKAVPGARFVPKDKGGPMWRLPADLTSGRLLREQFGDGLELGPKLKRWGRTAARKEENLTSLALADDAELEIVPKKLPLVMKAIAGKPMPELKLPKTHMLSKKRPARPFQRADIKFLSMADAINSNEPGSGKTLEAIAAVFEAELDMGPQLVVAPKTSLETVWQTELERWQPHPVLLTSGDDSKKRRQEVIDEAFELAADETPFWLVLNWHMVRMERDRTADMVKEDGHLRYPLIPVYGELFNIAWRTLILDEYHKAGLTNPKSLMSKSADELIYEKLMMLSGTPMGGKPLKLFAALQRLDPGRFTSKWRWAGEWLEVIEGEYEREGEVHETREVGDIRTEREEEFYKAHAPYLLRRTKAEIFPQLPPKNRMDVWCDMTPAQKKQYETISKEVEIKIETENLKITGVLAEYLRLKQFSNARQTIKTMGSGKMLLYPRQESGKLPQLLEILNNRGITGTDEEEGDQQVVVFSQFSAMVDMMEEWLNKQGIATAKITGDVTKKGERTRLQEQFQAEGGPRVMLMTTGAGGVSITLDRASTVVFLDETWDPDDQTQAEDRCHRGSRFHQVDIYYLRSKDSIEEYIQKVTSGKRLTNDQLLDVHRMMMKQKLEAAA
jgi:SNF2 family DNA or RNA helicase